MSIQYIDDMLKDYRTKKQPLNPKKINFLGVEGYDVYNISAPFRAENNEVIAGRVEKRADINAVVGFFKKVDGEWQLIKGTTELELQDPFHTMINGEHIVGGVEIFPHPDDPENRVHWRTKFYKGKDIYTLKEFFVGPAGMKDLRLVELAGSKVGIFTRPQGETGGRGKIGFTVIDSLDKLTIEVINKAPLLEQFCDDEWGGVNEAILLPNGKVGVLGHIAKFSEGNVRHYYSMVFCLDPLTKECTPMKIVAERKDFLPGPSKRDDLEDVIFSGGLTIEGDELATIYVGVSDSHAQQSKMKDPFYEYKN